MELRIRVSTSMHERILRQAQKRERDVSETVRIGLDNWLRAVEKGD
jgi:hypothetical protein